MNRKVVFVLGVLALIVLLLPATDSSAQVLPDYYPMDVGSEIRDWKPTLDRIAGAPDFAALNRAPSKEAAAGTPYSECVIDAKFWMSVDFGTGLAFFDTFFLVAETAGSELWVQADLSWPVDDPRDTPVVTCEQAQYMLGEFDNNIYPVETEFFGSPDFLDGSTGWLDEAVGLPDGYWSNEAGRQVVLVSNIIDDNYFDSTFPAYIAGFYTTSFDAWFGRNVMSIDAYDWENRIGPDSERPFLYESVFAHEYVHLLHRDYDSEIATWVSEGLAMIGGEFLPGYMIGDDAYSVFQERPENSLPVWEDQGGREIVADYGMSFLFHMYLYEKFGPEFIQYEFHNPDSGMESINSTLAAFGIDTDFAELYRHFAVAVLVDSARNGFLHGFQFGDVGIDIGTPDAPNPEAYDSPGAPPWGADYLFLDIPDKNGVLHFDGADTTTFPTPWTSDGEVLWSGDGDLIDNWAIFEATGGGTLSFDTLWDIEDYWDFGFVQVSNDGGHTWTSLSNAHTTDVHDPSAHPNIIANLPGLTGLNDWMNITYDLSAYSGDILLAFRYMTDWGTTFTGWFIDNVYVDTTLISDGSDVSAFKSPSELFPFENDFTVQIVGAKVRGPHTLYRTVATMNLDDATEEGYFDFERGFEDSDYAVMLVTSETASEARDFYAEYTYEVIDWD